jgi:LCP family protein required for cell wall assembly
MWLRFLLAGFLVVGLVAAATATAGLLGVQSFVNDIKQGGTIKNLGHIIKRADAGDPQTLLLIGSDHRARAGAHDARSDTMMLVRLDPDANAITVLSIPRDLKVSFQIPGGGFRSVAKINETYTDGGEALTAKVIEGLLQVPINHIVNVNFLGFRSVVNAIGCVYADVDRRYYHSNAGLPPSQQYSEINVPAGYQRLCGEQALEFVRFRHTDSDFVRAARQQDFLRQIKSQYGVGRFLADPHAITKRIGKFLRTDPSLQSKEELLKIGNLLVYTAGKPLREIHFPAHYDNVPGGASYVTATPADYAQVRREFLSPPPKPAKPARGHGGGHAAGHGSSAPSGLVNAATTGESYAIRLGAVPFPVYYPKLVLGRGGYTTPLPGENPRTYTIRSPDHKSYAAYRLVVSDGNDGNDYGVQGTTWMDPPILKNPSSDHRRVNGKRLDLYYDGEKLRLVAWRTSHAVYWISNTLLEELSNEQMLAIAGSLTRLGGHG